MRDRVGTSEAVSATRFTLADARLLDQAAWNWKKSAEGYARHGAEGTAIEHEKQAAAAADLAKRIREACKAP